MISTLTYLFAAALVFQQMDAPTDVGIETTVADEVNAEAAQRRLI
jgi:hypothetical protein